MHILILPSWYPAQPGDINGVFFREQALALSRHGHQVGVIHPQLRSLRAWKTIFTGKHGIKQEVDNGLSTLRSHGIAWLPRVSRANTWLWLRHGLKLYGRYVEEYGKPDLIHVHAMLNAGVLAQAIQRLHRIPFVVTEHFSGYARGTVGAEQLRTAASVARNAARRFAVSQPFCTLLQDMLGFEAGTWQAMPNIVERRFLDYPLPETNEPGEQFRFINVALLTENKGVHDLIRAFAQAFPGDSSVNLDLGGYGVERPRLESLAADLGVAERIRFLGALDRDQVADAMACADAFVLASRYETFGVVVIEALALGKPVIATRCGGPDSIVREEDGLLVPSDDIDALAVALRQMRADYARYRAADIRAGCIARYSEQVVVERLTRVYGEVLQEHTRG